MELQHYIESGIIESYALGLATAEEEAELEQMRRLFPVLQTEIAAAERRLEGIAAAEAVQPPPILKKRILQRINWQEPGQGRHNGGNTFINIQPKDGDYITVHKWWKIFFIIVFILSKIFLFLAIYFYLRFRQMEEKRQEKQSLQQVQPPPAAR